MCSWLTKFRNVNCQMWSPLCYDLRSSYYYSYPLCYIWSSSYSLIQGSIRSTVGQGRLVMSERFHQVWCFVILFPPGATFCFFCCWKILQCFSEVHGAGRQLRVWHGRKGNNCHGPDRILGDDLHSGADQLLGPFESNINTWLLRWKMWTPSLWSLAKLKQTGGWTTRSRWWRKFWRRRSCQVGIQIIFILINCNQFSNLKLEIGVKLVEPAWLWESQSRMATTLGPEKYGRINFSLGRWTSMGQNAPKLVLKHAKDQVEPVGFFLRSLLRP